MAIRMRSTNVTSGGEIGQLTFQERARAVRTTPTGADWKILGTLDTAKKVGTLGTLMVANTSATWHYVKFGADATVTAPTGLADGLPVPPNSIMYYCAEVNAAGASLAWVIADSAAVGGYVMNENVIMTDDQRLKD